MADSVPAKRAPALVSVVVALGLGWTGWLGWTSALQPRQPIPVGTKALDLELRPRARLDYVVIPDRPPPATPAERLETRLAAFASHVDRIRANIDPPLVAFGAEALRADIEQVIARVDDRAQVSVHVRDLESGRVLFDYFGDTLLNPASNNKLLTTSAALDLLGPDYVFETRALLVDETLYLIGEGDPTIDAAALGLLAQEVAERLPAGAITQILVDDSAFSPQVFGPGYAEQGWGVSYMAPSGALSVNFNTVEITVSAVEGEPKPVVVIEPASAHVVVDNRATLGTRTALEIRSVAEPPAASEPEREQVETRVVVEGRINKRRRGGYEVRRRVVDPGLFTGGAFAQLLADASQTEVLPVAIGVAPRVDLATLGSSDLLDAADGEHLELPLIVGQDRDGDDILLVARRQSPPLIEVVGGLLAYSNNFVAEQILRTLGWRMTGDPGDWDNGSAVIRGYWAALGIDPGALVYENGSGLSAVGRVTTTGLVDLMAVAARNQVVGASLFDALPVAGSMGTVRTRLRRSKRRVRAKTGTLDGVSGLTGVITTEDGTPEVAFSILTNVRESGHMAAATRRRTEDAIVMAVLDHIDGWEAIRAALILELEELSVTPSG